MRIITASDIHWHGNKIMKKFSNIVCKFNVMASRFLSSFHLKCVIKQLHLVFVSSELSHLDPQPVTNMYVSIYVCENTRALSVITEQNV